MPASICPRDWIHDGECDKVCNTAAHQFDGGDCDCVDMHKMCAAKVTQGQWSCETLLCNDPPGRCPKARLCSLTCASARGDHHCTQEVIDRALQGGGGVDAGIHMSPAERNRNEVMQRRADASTCPDAILHPSPLVSHCTRLGGICMENKDDCVSSGGIPGLVKGSCGESCGCCHLDLAKACHDFAGDGQCDALCNTERYGFDGAVMEEEETGGKGDCSSDAQFQACPAAWVGDGECDDECNNEENDYDYPDCTPTINLMGHGIPFCPSTWLVSEHGASKQARGPLLQLACLASYL